MYIGCVLKHNFILKSIAFDLVIHDWYYFNPFHQIRMSV